MLTIVLLVDFVPVTVRGCLIFHSLMQILLLLTPNGKVHMMLLFHNEFSYDFLTFLLSTSSVLFLNVFFLPLVTFFQHLRICRLLLLKYESLSRGLHLDSFWLLLVEEVHESRSTERWHHFV